MKSRKPIIAIDGPVGSGKSTTARKVARELGFVYVDTGAMYRAITVDVLEHGVDPEIEAGVKKIAEQSHVELLSCDEGSQRTILNGVDVTDRIRERDITSAVSAVSAMKSVRDKMTEIQREIGKNGGIVMEGRDIGTVVFPDAEFKIYIDASIEVRAQRRYKELAEKDIQVDINDLIREIRERDRLNTERALAPLRKAEDAIYIDTSDMTFNEQVSKIISIVRGEIMNEEIENIEHIRSWAYRISQFVTFVVYKIFFRISTEGLENIPPEGGVIIAPNHASLLDPTAVGGIIPRQISHMAKKELFSVPLVRFLLNVSKSVRVDRQGYTKGTIVEVIDLLRKGRAFNIFPEGTRTRTGEFGKPKKGVGMIAVMADVPVVPCWIEGSYKAKPFISKITLHFLPPIQPSEIKAETKKEHYLLVSEKIMCDIIRLCNMHNGRA